MFACSRVAASALLASGAASTDAEPGPASTPQEAPGLEHRELVAGLGRETSLYSRYENGRSSGFAAEILDAIAAEMQLQIRRTPLALHESPDAGACGPQDRSRGEPDQARPTHDATVAVRFPKARAEGATPPACRRLLAQESVRLAGARPAA